MKLLSIDPKKTRVVVQPRSAQDLWRLSELLEEGDVVTSRTERKIKVNEDTSVRKQVVLSIIAEKAEVSGELLRISGVVAEGLEEIPKGAHHTINIAPHDTLTIQKEWTTWQLEKLKEEESTVILVLLMDREEAVFALLRREPQILSTIKGTVQKKGMDGGSPYWEELAKNLLEYEARIRPRHIVIASPAFFKEYVLKLLPEEIAKKTVTATISATGDAALSELVRRPELRAVLEEERFSQENALMDRVLSAIHKEKAAWGITEVRELAPTGALEIILVSAAYMRERRERGEYESLRELLSVAEKTKTEVNILDTSAAAQLDKLGGIAAVRRW